MRLALDPKFGRHVSVSKPFPDAVWVMVTGC